MDAKKVGKWTPGPWTIEKPYGEPGIYITANPPRSTNPLICKMIMGNENANARLIAAAPMMVEALKEGLEALINETYSSDPMKQDTPWIRGVKERMKAALAAAEGRSDE